MNFKKIQELIGEGRTLSFTFTSKGDMGTISAYLINPSEDKALDNIPPFTVTAPLDKLEEEFVNAFHKPLVNTVATFNSTIEYEKQLKEQTAKTKAAEELKKKKKTIVDEYEKIKKEDGFDYAEPKTKARINKCRTKMMKLQPDHKIISEVLHTSIPQLF